MIRTPHFALSWPRIHSLVRDLRSCKPHGRARKRNKKFPPDIAAHRRWIPCLDSVVSHELNTFKRVFRFLGYWDSGRDSWKDDNTDTSKWMSRGLCLPLSASQHPRKKFKFRVQWNVQQTPEECLALLESWSASSVLWFWLQHTFFHISPSSTFYCLNTCIGIQIFFESGMCFFWWC